MAESSAAVGASFLAAAHARAGQERPSQRHSCTIAQTLRGAALAAARRAARAGRRSAELQAHPPSHSAHAVARGADLAALCAPTAGVERRPRTATAAARRDAPGVLRTTREMVDIEIPAQTQERAVRVGLSEARKGPTSWAAHCHVGLAAPATQSFQLDPVLVRLTDPVLVRLTDALSSISNLHPVL